FERVRASHHAIGVPTSSRITVLTVASWKVSQTADQSALVREGMLIGSHRRGKIIGGAKSAGPHRRGTIGKTPPPATTADIVPRPFRRAYFASGVASAFSPGSSKP